MAAAELNCPQSEIKVRKPRRTQAQTLRDDITETPEHQLATGCGRAAMYVISCPPGERRKAEDCNWLSVTKLKTEHLVRRASFDMQCAPNALQLTWLDKMTTGVTGCGQRVTYVLNCPHSPDLWSQQCAWVLNTDSFRQGALGSGMHAPPPPAPVPPSQPPPPTAAPAPPPPPPAPTESTAEPAPTTP